MKKLFRKGMVVISLFLGLLLYSIILGNNNTYTEAAASDFDIHDNVLIRYNGTDADVIIPDGVTEVTGGAFSYNKNIKSVYVPSSVTAIQNDGSLFDKSLKLEVITVSKDNPNYKDENGVLFNKSGSELLIYPAGKGDINYVIPNTVTSIANGAFEDCINLNSVSLPDKVKSIGIGAFYGCYNLVSINIPDSVETIETLAFMYCLNLPKIILPESVKTINLDTFSYCYKLESLLIYNDEIEIKKDSYLYFLDMITFYGHKGSTTETFALENNYDFKELDDANKPLFSISLQKTNVTLAVGNSTLNHVIYNPSDTTDSTAVKWSSSNPGIARVLSNGKIQAVSQGTVIITATVGNLAATCTVTVK